jgi:hypothetical protein
MARETAKKCAHPACTCTVGKDTNYCSQYCKDAGGTMEISCNCGHQGCAIEDTVPTGGGGRASRL